MQLNAVLLIALFALVFSQTPISVTSHRFYVGGRFSNVKNKNITTNTIQNVAANNIASFDGSTGLWSAIASGTSIGTNGAVEVVKVDAVRSFLKN
jgi:hypothetical protein